MLALIDRQLEKLQREYPSVRIVGSSPLNCECIDTDVDRQSHI